MELKKLTGICASGKVFWSLRVTSALGTSVDDGLFPQRELGVTAAPSRYLFCDECAEGFRVSRNSPFITQPPQMESKWADGTSPFSWKIFLAVERPQKSSSSFHRDPVIFFPPMVIQSCSFRKELSINLPVLWAAFRAFFVRLSTLMLMRSLRVQSCHLFVSSACDWTYLYQTRKGWIETRFLKTQRISAWDWLVGSGRRGLFPWDTTPLLSQSTTTGGIVPRYVEAAAFKINCVMTPPSISPQ